MTMEKIIQTNNSFLSQSCNAQYVYCQKNKVAPTNF